MAKDIVIAEETHLREVGAAKSTVSLRDALQSPMNSYPPLEAVYNGHYGL